MHQTYLGPPFLVIILAAACWVWWHALRWPEQVAATRRGRVRAAAVEGMICGSVWNGMEVWVQQARTSEAVLTGLLAGGAWAGTAWWTRARIVATRHQIPQDTPPPTPVPVAAHGRHHNGKGPTTSSRIRSACTPLACRDAPYQRGALAQRVPS